MSDWMVLSRRGLMIGGAVVAFGACRGVGAQAPAASPVAGVSTPFIDRLNELLAIAPATAADAAGEQSVLLSFADLERQLTAVGVPAPSGGDMPEGFIQVIEALPLSSTAFRYGLSPEWSSTFGFEPFSVGRVLEVGEPPNMVTIFAGVDTERVRAALLESGYQEIDQETGGSYLTFGDDFSPSTSVGQLGVGSMNQAALGEDLVVFTREESTIQQVTQVMAGYAASMLEQGSLPDLMATFAADTVGVIALHPSVLSEFGDVSAIQQIALGVRAGADNRDLQAGASTEDAPSAAALPETRARVQVRIRYSDEAIASAEADAIPERWAETNSLRTDQPLSELMLIEEAGVVEGDPTVAAIDFRVNGPAGRWYQLIYNRDLAPFVPAG